MLSLLNREDRIKKSLLSNDKSACPSELYLNGPTNDSDLNQKK